MADGRSDYVFSNRKCGAAALSGHDAGCRTGVLFERRHEPEFTAAAFRLRRGCDGGRIRMEPDHSGHQSVGASGQAGVSAGLCGRLGRIFVFDAAGPGHPPSACGQ